MLISTDILKENKGIGIIEEILGTTSIIIFQKRHT